MSSKKLFILITALLTALSLVPSHAQAAGGLPDTPQFGYGVRVDLQGMHVTAAIEMAKSLSLGWVALDFDWARYWPDETLYPDLSVLDPAIQLADQLELDVLLSIGNPPQWALAPNGPRADTTAWLVTMLAQRYASSVLVIELFPGANTNHGWGAAPNAADYLNVLAASQASLQAAGSTTYLIPGLVPIDPDSGEAGISDLEFLSALYALNAQPLLPMIGVRFPEVVGTPMTMPNPAEQHILRHYEEVRAVMLQNGHQDGRIWITGFCWAVGNSPHPTNLGITNITSTESQAEWTGQAYQLMKAQLFIGAAFFSQANPPAAGSNSLQPALIQADATQHPAGQFISRVIQGEIIALPPSDELDSLMKKQSKADALETKRP